MQITTTRFGLIDVAEEAILQFPRGLYGLEERRMFCLIQHDEAGCFHWLQSVDVPALAMLVTDPFQFVSSYEVEIGDADAELLHVTTSAEVATYVTVTLGAGGKQITVNLLGPLVVNHAARLGAQVIQDANRYNTRHPIGPRLGEGRTTPDKMKSAINGAEPPPAERGTPGAAGEGRSRRFRPFTVPV